MLDCSVMWNRLWMGAIAASMVLWAAIMVDRLGAVYVVGFIALAFLFRRFNV